MKKRKMAILLVDDDGNDRFLVRTAFKQIGLKDPLYGVSDGAQAIAYLKGEGEYADRDAFVFPGMLLIDLKMPRLNGFELLRFLRDYPHLSVIPTIVLTSSSDPNDITNAYLLGAKSYQIKAQTLDGLRDQMKLIYDYWRHCEAPETDRSGNLTPTFVVGKLSERVHMGPARSAIKN
jgi:CheY-like chemotaxis protein